ncbi:MAG: copper resistance protein B, partial [Luteimonas sp.]
TGCTPEHAAMGHCTLRPAAPVAPLTPIPALTDADRAAAFPALHHHSMEHASPVHHKVYLERLEAWDTDHGTGQLWKAKAWLGTDLDRLWLRSEGERAGGRTGSADVEALYGRSIGPWWDLVAGVRQETRPAARTWGAFGLQGLAPYLFEVSATAYVGSGGQVLLKAEAEYDVRFTNRLVLQPLIEVTAALEDEPSAGIGSGLNKLETGLRLRYEVSRRFAPYVGLVHERGFGRTADYARTAGVHVRDTRVVGGIRIWF